MDRYRRHVAVASRCLLLVIVLCVRGSGGWHAFDNTEYHCWDLTASSSNPVPFACSGLDVRWITTPGDTITSQEEFSVTFELTIHDAFYTWAFDNNYFGNVVSVSNAADAKTWCETTICPAAKDATETNCCIWHVNVHSCPLADTDNGLCGPWIQPSGSTFTHSEVLVGPVGTGNWTCHVSGLYEIGVTSLIAHFRVAGMQLALETETNVIPRTVCGDGECEGLEGEDCESCPKDCGKCPLKAWQIALIGAFGFLVIAGIVAVVVYFQYQKRRLLWDESWIIPFDEIKEDEGNHGAFGSMMGSAMDLSTAQSDGTSSMAQSAANRQIFVKTAIFRGRNYAVKAVRKKEFTLTKSIRLEVREIRDCDQINVCRFIGASIVVPHIRILTEYCPKGSLSDVLLNDDIPLNWAFRFAFATDVARGMQHLHSHKIFHGRLKSNNCVVDDRWTTKITDFGLPTLRHNDCVTMEDDYEDNEEEYNKEKRAQIYKAPEFLHIKDYIPTFPGDVYAFAIILLEIATRNDPYGDEDAFSVAPGWRPNLPDMSPEKCETQDDICPCPQAYLDLVQECWQSDQHCRPTFDLIKKQIHKINPSKLSPVDLMMAMMEKYSKHLEAIVAERTQDLVAEKAKTDRLLYSMLPRAVADDLRLGRAVEAKFHDHCTIYFSDIVGFTTISGRSSALQVVGLLNKLYITFDEIIDKYDVYKVETIGDAYMVVSGIPVHTPHHAREIAEMSIDLVNACKIFKIPHMLDEPLKIRVGLHSGSACAGVVGLKMPRYCLFGDTVNTASRMESNGEAYKIHISNFTYEDLVKYNRYNIEKRGTIPIKGKGEMTTWWLHGYDPVYMAERRKEQESLNTKNLSLSSVNQSITILDSLTGTPNGSVVAVKNAKNLHNHNNQHHHKVPTDRPNGIHGVAHDSKRVKYEDSVVVNNACAVNNAHSDSGVRGDHNNASLNMDGGHNYINTGTHVTTVNEAETHQRSARTYGTGSDLIQFDAYGHDHHNSEPIFTPVELAVTEPNQRKISKISTMTSDSGYTDKSDDIITGRSHSNASLKDDDIDEEATVEHS